mmetsp:Transcript_36077/g.112758  ORF Transcript_36077/g.112758 Transcript_36077/m.112758 type:complete len:118 (+) Transcript_36077:537-890(+)
MSRQAARQGGGSSALHAAVVQTYRRDAPVTSDPLRNDRYAHTSFIKVLVTQSNAASPNNLPSKFPDRSIACKVVLLAIYFDNGPDDDDLKSFLVIRRLFKQSFLSKALVRNSSLMRL